MRYDFELLGEKIIGLQEHRYLSVVEIDITEGPLTDFKASDLFRGLMSHPVYRDHYVGQDSYESTGDQPLHGPYWIEHLQPEHYREMEFPELKEKFNIRLNDPDWVEYGGSVSGFSEREVEAILNNLPENTRCFELALEQGKNKDYCHEVALPAQDFREYPLILVPDRRLRLCVFNFD